MNDSSTTTTPSNTNGSNLTMMPLGALTAKTPPPPNDDIQIVEDPRETEIEKLEEANICVICQNAWSSSGEHMVCGCRCGHMFGRSCIMKWVAEKHCCPICKAQLNTFHVFPLFFASSTSSVFLMEMRREMNRENADLQKRFRRERVLRKKAEAAFHEILSRLTHEIERLNGNHHHGGDDVVPGGGGDSGDDDDEVIESFCPSSCSSLTSSSSSSSNANTNVVNNDSVIDICEIDDDNEVRVVEEETNKAQNGKLLNKNRRPRQRSNITKKQNDDTKSSTNLQFLHRLKSEMESYKIPVPFGVRDHHHHHRHHHQNGHHRDDRKRSKSSWNRQQMSDDDDDDDYDENHDDEENENDGDVIIEGKKRKLDSNFPSYREQRSIVMTRPTKFFDFIDPGTIVHNNGNMISIFDTLHSITTDFTVSDHVVTNLIYDCKQKNSVICSTLHEILFVDMRQKNIGAYLKVDHPIQCMTLFNEQHHHDCGGGSGGGGDDDVAGTSSSSSSSLSSPYFAVGSLTGQVDIYDSRFINQCKSISSFIVQNPIDEIQSISHIPMPNQSSGLLVAKGKTNGKTFFCKSVDNVDWEVTQFPLPSPGTPTINYHVQYDPVSRLCVSSFTTPATQTMRSIRHFLFPFTRAQFDNALTPPVVTSYDQATLPLPSVLQPTYFQKMGQQYLPTFYSSPTHLYSVGYSSRARSSQPTLILDDANDDLQIVSDSQDMKRKTILATTEFTSVRLVDAKTRRTLQVLPSEHRLPIESFKSIAHPLGNYVGQLSRDRFTLFRLDES